MMIFYTMFLIKPLLPVVFCYVIFISDERVKTSSFSYPNLTFPLKNITQLAEVLDCWANRMCREKNEKLGICIQFWP